MARDKRPPRKSIRPYYFIVEGYTEENYLCLLKQIKNTYNLNNFNTKIVFNNFIRIFLKWFIRLS